MRFTYFFIRTTGGKRFFFIKKKKITKKQKNKKQTETLKLDAGFYTHESETLKTIIITIPTSLSNI